MGLMDRCGALLQWPHPLRYNMVIRVIKLLALVKDSPNHLLLQRSQLRHEPQMHHVGNRSRTISGAGTRSEAWERSRNISGAGNRSRNILKARHESRNISGAAGTSSGASADIADSSAWGRHSIGMSADFADKPNKCLL